MLKFFIIVVIVHQAMPVEYFLARMKLLVERNPTKNIFLKAVKKYDNYAKGNSTQDFTMCLSCRSQESLDIDHTVDEFVYGEDLQFSWKNNIHWLERKDLQGHLSVKYQNDKYPQISSGFMVCEDNSGQNRHKSLGQYIFEQIFVRGYHEVTGCLHEKSFHLGDKFFINDGEMYNGIHCDTNATIRLDLRGTVKANCGVGGSGDVYSYHVFRVVFNARFENCDGKKYDFLRGLNAMTISTLKLSMAKDTNMQLANNPIL